jgi:hypothetical protein
MAAAALKGQAPAAAPEPEGHEVAAVLLALVAEMNLRELVLVVLASAGMVDTGVGSACEVAAYSYHMVVEVDSMVDTDHGSTVVAQDSHPVLSCLMAELVQLAAVLVCLRHPGT